MISLAYISNSSKRYTDDELKHMLKDFQRRNATQNISGVLLYNGAGTFIQVIEGEEKPIDELFNKIKRDIRHKNVYCLRRAVIKEKSFVNWKMGFRNLSKDSTYHNEHFSEFMNDKNLDHFIASDTDFALKVLTHFKDTAKELIF